MIPDLFEPAKPVATPEFDRFWAVYPRREDRKRAAKAFERAITIADPLAIVSAAVLYAEYNRGKEKKYIKLAATWLHGECWENEMPNDPANNSPENSANSANSAIQPPIDPVMQARVGALMAGLSATLKARAQANAEVARRKAQERDARRREYLAAQGIKMRPRPSSANLRPSPELERIVRQRMVQR